MLGARGHMLHEKILKIWSVWCILVDILIKLYLEKLRQNDNVQLCTGKIKTK